MVPVYSWCAPDHWCQGSHNYSLQKASSAGEAKSHGRVGRGSCLFEDKKGYILAPSVLGPNLS